MSSKKFREFESPSGYKVIVGKNDKANDELSFNLADPDDLWFHVANIPGPHVLLRYGDGVTKADISFAARLAVQYSKAKSGGLVDYCHARDLKRTKTLGLVIMFTKQSICV
jgi:predicted ribosome quality control (RQC) complex YloA/Tae2 family protein